MLILGLGCSSPLNKMHCLLKIWMCYFAQLMHIYKAYTACPAEAMLPPCNTKSPYIVHVNTMSTNCVFNLSFHLPKTKITSFTTHYLCFDNWDILFHGQLGKNKVRDFPQYIEINSWGLKNLGLTRHLTE